MSEVNKELKNIIEAALLVAGRPLGVRKLQFLFPEDARPEADEIKAVLQALEVDCAGRGIELRQVGKGWRFQSRPQYSEWIARLSEERPARYSRALLETLAIIAYRQPVTRGDIEEIRGVSVSSETVRTLTERGWVREVGHRDVPGKPALFGTTSGFLEHFNLKTLSELPPLSELRDLDEISAELNMSLDFSDDSADGELAQIELGSGAEDADLDASVDDQAASSLIASGDVVIFEGGPEETRAEADEAEAGDETRSGDAA